MNIWIAGKDLMKNSYQIKKALNSKLNFEDITDKDYAHGQKVWEVYEIKNLGEYYDCMFNSIPYCLLIYLKYINVMLLVFCLHQD